MVGGYTNNDTLEWIKYFLPKISIQYHRKSMGIAYHLNLINRRKNLIILLLLIVQRFISDKLV